MCITKPKSECHTPPPIGPNHIRSKHKKETFPHALFSIKAHHGRNEPELNERKGSPVGGCELGNRWRVEKKKLIGVE